MRSGQSTAQFLQRREGFVRHEGEVYLSATHMRLPIFVLGSLLVSSLLALRTPQAPDQTKFWAALQQLCGRAYAGSLVQGAPSDTAFAGKTLVIHVRQCTDSSVHIPLHAGTDRSRTWVIARSAGSQGQPGLRLKHDHRHEDGKPDSVTQYGGDTRTNGSATVQEFYADAFTTKLIPAAATNVWTVEVVAGTRLAYALRREGTDRRVRLEFDLTRTVPAPPAPWGHRE